ncbi:DNA polymerase II small subunit [Halogranum amylolyticum]|uniref:DNA polymerase II small subunit n=1 Tax=Halogranum amylolyticum TaxID=660520 RepID=A0A1H8R2A0_9EURY|nr:DNA-directed DNA polymerase II small subunit [Halogranum amylolyticum]SEO60274.1 DNA polymerase II small subunit [Halogranum amylolyticum]
MPLSTPSALVAELARRGYNAEREAITLLANAADPAVALERTVEHVPDDALRITADHVRTVLDTDKLSADAQTTSPSTPDDEVTPSPPRPTDPDDQVDPSGSTGTDSSDEVREEPPAPVETGGSTAAVSPATEEEESTSATAEGAESASTSPATPSQSTTPGTSATPSASNRSEPTSATSNASDRSEPTSTHTRNPEPADIANDMTGQSTGTGEYKQFVTTFKDRYERLSKLLRGRVNHRPAEAIQKMPGGSDAELIGLVNDVRSTASGHWLVELEDTTGTFPCLVMKDKNIAELVDQMLMDECVAVQGTLSDDAGILFADTIHFPDVPRTHRPKTADRHVQAALISDVHVGSQEFMADAWNRFTDWLHTPEAEAVEYLLIAGDMVEGVGIYPNQDEELDIIDIYEQYEQFSEYLKQVPGDVEIVMIPGNHDAVRLAEPQPGFDDELRDIMSAHDARITSNPSTVTVENVSVLMYHGVSLDEVIAELPSEKASYDEPHKAMYQLLKKRHVAPQYGGHMRLAPEEKDYLVIDDVPDVFHTGHVHKLGWGKYHNVLAVNSGCWQAQTDFQKSVNIDPDAGYAPILDLDTLEMTVRKFA